MKNYIKWYKKLYKDYGFFVAIGAMWYNGRYYDPDNLGSHSYGERKEVSLCGGEKGSTDVESTQK